MRRVKLTPAGLKISKTGYDVETAGPEGLSLDTVNWKMLSVLLQGSKLVSVYGANDFTVDSSTSTGSGASYHLSYRSHCTIPFGVTLSAPPICLLTYKDPQAIDGTAAGNSFAYTNATLSWSGDSGGAIAYGAGGSSVITYSVSNSALTISYAYEFFGFVNPPDAVWVHYLILRTP